MKPGEINSGQKKNLQSGQRQGTGGFQMWELIREREGGERGRAEE